MKHLDEYISGCQRLLLIMEEDSQEIAQGLGGELLEAYRKILEQEKKALNDALRQLKDIQINDLGGN